MDGLPSSLKPGDIVLCNKGGTYSFLGEVSQVFENGAFINPVNEYGIRLLRKTEWCSDTDTFIEEINGESMF